MGDQRLDPRLISGAGASPDDVLTYKQGKGWAPAPAGGGSTDPVASIALYGSDLGATERIINKVSNAQFRDAGCAVAAELTCEAGTIVSMAMEAPGSPETLVDTTVFGYGLIAKVRNAAGAVVTPSAWHLGSWTYDASLPDNVWVGSDANTADFTFAGGSAVQLTLGGTYLFSLGIYLP